MISKMLILISITLFKFTTAAKYEIHICILNSSMAIVESISQSYKFLPKYSNVTASPNEINSFSDF